MILGVFAAVLLGLFSYGKESALVAVPLLPWVALVSAPILHPDVGRGARCAR